MGSKIRHTFATWALSAGVDVMALRKALGHTTLALVSRYRAVTSGTTCWTPRGSAGTDLGYKALVPGDDPDDKPPEGGEVGHTSSFVLPGRKLSAEQRAAISVRNSEIMRRRVAAGMFVSPTKSPAVARKISDALLGHVSDGTWKRQPAPTKDPITGRWIRGRVST